MAVAAPTRRSPLAANPTAKRRLVVDRLSRWVTVGGGLAIIASILGILVFLVLEVLPILRPAHVAVGAARTTQPGLLALVVDEHRAFVTGITAAGELQSRRLPGAEVVASSDLLAVRPADEAAATAPVAAATITGARALPGSAGLAAATSDGRVVYVPVAFGVRFDGDRRVVEPQPGTPVAVALDPAGGPIGAFAVRATDDGLVAAGVLASGEIALVRSTTSEDFSGETHSETTRTVVAPPPGAVTALAVDGAGRTLYAGTRDGNVVRWLLGDEVSEGAAAPAGSAAITALELLIGDRALVAGSASGAVSVWFPVGEDRTLVHVRDFPSLAAAITTIAPSQRDKGFLVAAKDGALSFFYDTSHRTLWTGRLPVAGVTGLVMAPKEDAAYASTREALVPVEIAAPHPEISWRALFGKVWYEGYEKPEYVWQSTGGTDDFEPKLSLVPLLVGTLKGTIYSLLLAIPLGVFGAMYLSQFMHPSYKRYVKPVIEIMAALPSVVLGFLAGLWLAPRVEKAIPGVFAMLLVVPLAILAAGSLWSLLPKRLRGRFPSGTEAFVFLFAIAGALWLCFEASPWVERVVFGGSFPEWLRSATGLAYDQRNAVVVGLAMGFAVIPIIFAIAEDAFSNVPRNLVAGSLALGANRWQTVTRVVLPTASPGIFSAVMIGFGRAIGETMIVLMATGNTPILDWNPFNGFRTLSANIAVEIPEAPMSSTLYRTLFLAALLLFALTFAVNTLAELVRQRLRQRYSQL